MKRKGINKQQADKCAEGTDLSFLSFVSPIQHHVTCMYIVLGTDDGKIVTQEKEDRPLTSSKVSSGALASGTCSVCSRLYVPPRNVVPANPGTTVF